ncbi:hypothetical protein AB9X41_24010 [Ralstonia solanacearum]|uniref:hypothetical protein n=1 Tax=Ralstonia solanacearum TaxID=305 RepID=UPI00159539E1|nr:hypothetical protein [Ralstonia solanacearum]
MSPLARMMAIAKAQQHIDPDLFDLFLSSGVYLRCAKRFVRAEQTDEVDVARYGDGGSASSREAA